MIKFYMFIAIILITLLTVIFADYRGLFFDPLGHERNHSIYLAKEGDERFVVTCIYNGAGAYGQHAIQWINENGEIISSTSSINVQSNSRGTEKKLIFTSVKKHDTGEYKCRVRLRNGDFLENVIFIKVISNIVWNAPNNVVGGNLGEPLTIDCGARGEPMPHIEIAGLRGQSVLKLGYKIIENKITISKLKMEHRNLTFKCVAVQTLNIVDQFNTTVANEHDITVDVFYAPEFEFPEVETYTATGKNVSLKCLVTASNPRVVSFNFYRGNEILFNHERYEVYKNYVHQMAEVRISTVEDDDYGRYRCVAKNGKLTGEQMLVLKKSVPPRQPQVNIVEVGNNSVILRVLENREVDDLPVLSYSISYKTKRVHAPLPPSSEDVQLALLGESTGISEENAALNAYKQRTINFFINMNNSYEIKGLEPNVEYELFVRPMNDVGEGDPVMLDVITGTRSFNDYYLHSAASIEQLSVIALLSCMALVMNFFQHVITFSIN